MFKQYSKAIQIAFLVCFVIALALYVRSIGLNNVAENIAFYFDPSAERAYLYGEKHFDARHAGEYDLARARHFFLEAQKINPELPFVNHELGRIAFLRGDFFTALSLETKEIELNASSSIPAYYMRALTKGYLADYAGAIEDYETYFSLTPANWAAINDYSWVLMKAGRVTDALNALEWGDAAWPDNAWLLSNKATALYELGHYAEAKKTVIAAIDAVEKLGVAEWLNAYPGNDPLIAGEGLKQFKDATEANLQKILGKTN